MKSKIFKASSPIQQGSEKQTRLTKALRDNLKKRKLQAKSRKIEKMNMTAASLLKSK